MTSVSSGAVVDQYQVHSSTGGEYSEQQCEQCGVMLYVADWFHDKYDRYIDKTETYRWGQGCSVQTDTDSPCFRSLWHRPAPLPFPGRSDI